MSNFVCMCVCVCVCVCVCLSPCVKAQFSGVEKDGADYEDVFFLTLDPIQL